MVLNACDFSWCLAPPFSGTGYSLSQLYDPLVDLLAVRFNASDHLVVHPCGHWVIKRLLINESGEEKRKGEEGGGKEGEEVDEREEEDEGEEGMEEGGKGREEDVRVGEDGNEVEGEVEGNVVEGEVEEKEEGEAFAERILCRVLPDDIRAWTTTNRGAFVTCR